MDTALASSRGVVRQKRKRPESFCYSWADPHGRRQFGKRDELTFDLYMRRVGAQSERLGTEKKRHP